MIQKTDAYVLKSFDYRETSKIVTFLTKEYGKLRGVLKGIRKDFKKFGSNVDKFSLNEIIYYGIVSKLREPSFKALDFFRALSEREKRLRASCPRTS